MYYFGVFSSHIPYILFTVVYMVYLGVFSLKKPKCEEVSQSTAEQTIQQVVSVSAKAEQPEKTYIAFDQHFSGAYLAETVYQPHIADRSGPAVYCPDSSIRTVVFGFSDFSRPPPALV